MMVHRLKDIVVVLTGASSGIGASIAEHLLKEGAKVRFIFSRLRRNVSMKDIRY